MPKSDPIEPAPAPAPAPAVSVKHWLAVKGTHVAFFRAACHRNRWAFSEQTAISEVTEAEYDAAVYSVQFDRL